MSTLSPRGRALVSAGRRAALPTGEDRARTAEALRAELGVAALPADAALATSASAARRLWPFVSAAVVVGAGIVGVTLSLAHHPTTGREPPAMVSDAPRGSAVPVSAPPEAAPGERPVTAPAPSPSVEAVAPRTSTRRQQDQLAAEVAILSRATHALHARRADQALRALDDYRRKFPKGLLVEEERAARAQALCSLGRFDEANANLAGLTPQSPLSLRATQFCAAVSRAH